MGKKRLNNIKKVAGAIFVMLLLFSILPLLSSCKGDYQKALEGANANDTSSSSAISKYNCCSKNTSADDSSSAQDNNTENETADEILSDTSESASISQTTETDSQNTNINDNNQQIIEVIARSGGYYPEKIEAKAGVPTTLIINSKDAYGCERAFIIPDLNISEILPENGTTSFDLGVQPKGTKLVGVCSMGMYYFVIIFS
ncbi:MAG: hypothetical protein FJW69_06300 [Actinobacteria bacterium]|nr:hypothetical protein [Actinomycetota bacterium]